MRLKSDDLDDHVNGPPYTTLFIWKYVHDSSFCLFENEAELHAFETI